MRKTYFLMLPFLLAALVLLMDQWSKGWMLTHLTPGVDDPITGFLNFNLRFNFGAAFGFLQHGHGVSFYFLTGLGLMASIVLSALIVRWARVYPLRVMALSFVLGGAIGNVIDRLQMGYVIDFIDIHAYGLHFATFNIADAAITVGAIVLIIDSCCRPQHPVDRGCTR